MRRSGRAIVTAIACFIAAACAGDKQPAEPEEPQVPPPARTPTLTILAGNNVTDTITAMLRDSLVVEVRDADNRPVAGEYVTFVRMLPASAYMGIVLEAPNVFAGTATVATNAAGRAAVRLQMGIDLGEAGITIIAPRINLTATARYTITPGQPARVEAVPADTGLFAGRKFSVRTRVADRGEHVLNVTPAFEVVSGPFVASLNGEITATGLGTGQVKVRAGSGSEIIQVTGVPNGALVLATLHDGIVVTNLDGSSYRKIADNGHYPVWSPNGDRVVYEGANGRLMVQTLTGQPALFVKQDTTKGAHSLPAFTRDGRYVYFTTSADMEPQEIWRVDADGSNLRRVSPRPPISSEVRPSPSPDGNQLAFNAALEYGWIRVRDLISGGTSGNLAQGQMPAWSPVANQIAFTEDGFSFEHAVMIINADGTGLRQLTPAGASYGFGVNWSPDGRWLVAAHDAHAPQIIEAATGFIIHWGFLDTPIISGAWRPSGIIP